jgi:Phage integrase family
MTSEQANFIASSRHRQILSPIQPRTWHGSRGPSPSRVRNLSPDWAEHRYAGKILQVDLLAAKVDYVDANGLFADFHALRHTFITNLGRHGVPLVAAQKLARHSTPVLTAARYTHIDLADQSREVQKLPRLLGTHMGQTGDVSCPKASTDGNKSAAGLPGENPRKPAAILIKMQRRGGDSNPRSGCPDSGFQDRCNRPLCHLSGFRGA